MIQYPPKWAELGPNLKNVVLLQGKFDSKKYTETETWRPVRLEECSYYRLCKSF